MSPAEVTAEVTDRWPLAPLQAGMLVQALREEGSDIDLVQHLFDLDGDLDLTAFTEAWTRMARRHGILRSGFAWQDCAEPEQRVFADVAHPLTVHDWRGLSDTETGRRVEALLAADRRAGIRLDRPPPSRLTLLRTGERSHRLLWTSHHALLDGWSRSLLLREVMAHYARALSGEPHEDGEPAPRYGDFVAWLREQDDTAAKAVWRDVLGGFAAPTPLRLVPAEPGDGTGELVRTLSRPVTEALSAFTRQRRLTTATVLHGALAVVLSRYSGSRDVLFGATLSLRPPDLDGAEDLVGLLINTIPVRAVLRPEAEVTGWLRAFQDTLLELREYGHCALSDLRAYTEVPSGTPLFDTLLVFENYPGAEEDGWSAPGLRMRFRHTTGRTGYPLTITVEPGETTKLVYEYERARLDADAVARIADSLDVVLTSLTTLPPHGRIGDLTVIPEDRPGHPSRPPSPQVPCAVHELVAAQVARDPDAAAVITDEVRLTYGELWSRAGALAGRLRAVGVGRETPVGVCLERSADLVVALLAVLRAGGVCLLLEPTFPERRIRCMLDDSGAVAVIAPESFSWPGPVLDVAADTGPGSGRGSAGVSGEAAAHPDDLAYLVYTSGSTGTPKGVAVTHRSIATHCDGIGTAYGLGPADTVLQFASVAFDASVEQLLAPLVSGAAVLLRGPELWEPRELLARLRRHRVTVMELTPEYWYQLITALEDDPHPPLDHFRLMNVGGDAVAPDQLTRWASRTPHTRTVNSYGPAEATITATVWTYDGSCPTPIAPIGSALPHAEVHVLDADLRPAPFGVPGEICVGGTAVARGYPGRAALTAERFAPDPYSATPGARLYRTGDVGRQLPDGNLEFLGRLDDQVQIRGIRIEPAEIAAHLRRNDAVAEAVVVPRDAPDGGRTLAAYVTPASADPGALRAFLRESLPEAMVPAVIVPLDRIPLTATGKTDRAALPAPAPTEPTDHRGTPPGTALERTLADIWSQVLGVGHIGVHDDFFELGGHSLTMMRVLALARKERVRGLTLRMLFRHPTVACLAHALETGGSGR
ncbi:amino acid adenylation domain-containing protein [Streptomyces sp. NPDC050704]|uniref:amino acid adenylation domain-containing protein n=1 Tax=Streptomyces sp. NPDC050704 TaxID=3157219 RepID=UPI00342BDC93